ERTGHVLKCVGTSVLLVWASTVGGFVAAALIPVPALRAFVFQAALLHTFAVAAMLLLFPAAVSVDLRRRRRSHRLCCWNDEEAPVETQVQAPSKRQALARALPPDQSHVVTVLAPTGPLEPWVGMGELPAPNPLQQWRRWSLSYFVSYYYAPFLQQTPIKVLTVLGLASLLSASAWGALRADEGLALSEVVPGGSQEQAFLRAQGRYFGFFHMFAVTRGNFEYPTKQRLLLEYHEAFTSVEHVIKNDDGGLPDFWLTLFRDWLLGGAQGRLEPHLDSVAAAVARAADAAAPFEALRGRPGRRQGRLYPGRRRAPQRATPPVGGLPEHHLGGAALVPLVLLPRDRAPPRGGGRDHHRD
ncbi:unnamed protein product, partial [Ixodes pacificus]